MLPLPPVNLASSKPTLNCGEKFTLERCTKLLRDTSDCFTLNHSTRVTNSKQKKVNDLQVLKESLSKYPNPNPGGNISILIKRFHIIKQHLPAHSQHHLQIKLDDSQGSDNLTVDFLFIGKSMLTLQTPDVIAALVDHCESLIESFLERPPTQYREYIECADLLDDAFKETAPIFSKLAISESEVNGFSTEVSETLLNSMRTLPGGSKVDDYHKFDDNTSMSSWKDREYATCEVVDSNPVVIRITFSDDIFFSLPPFPISTEALTENLDDYVSELDSIFRGEKFKYSNFDEFSEGILKLNALRNGKKYIPITRTQAVKSIIRTKAIKSMIELIKKTGVLKCSDSTTTTQVLKIFDDIKVCDNSMKSILELTDPDLSSS